MNFILLLPLVVTLVAVLVLTQMGKSTDQQIGGVAQLASVAISLSVLVTLWLGYDSRLVLLTISDTLSIALQVDGLTVFFALLVSILWPIATFYARTYMTHEGKFQRFFAYYTLTFGVVLGLAMSDNLLTLYLFYEMLTFVTLPLVTHNGKPRDVYAGKTYISYMMLGAGLSFAGMVVFLSQVGNLDFVAGGLTSQPLSFNLMVAYLLMFCGFSVKAGMFPFHGWLINAGVAPTTVTALLHAVAVVKSGAFATMRLTYYLYDPATLQGTGAQTIIMVLVSISVVFGSSMACRSKHLKRRLAFSTVSQLSYILLGVVTMSVWGLQAALLHMAMHACIKIVLFYDAGNILYTNHGEFVDNVAGYGKIMKSTCFTFVLCGIALLGVPPFGAFFSKFSLAMASLSVGGWLGIVGVVALISSAFFTAIYVFQIILKMYFPGDTPPSTTAKDAPATMGTTVVVLTGMMIVLSLGAGYLYDGIALLLKGVG